MEKTFKKNDFWVNPDGTISWNNYRGTYDVLTPEEFANVINDINEFRHNLNEFASRQEVLAS
jgi:hypothetical protein